MRRKSRTSCWSNPRRAVGNARIGHAGRDDGSGARRRWPQRQRKRGGALGQSAARQVRRARPSRCRAASASSSVATGMISTSSPAISRAGRSVLALPAGTRKCRPRPGARPRPSAAARRSPRPCRRAPIVPVTATRTPPSRSPGDSSSISVSVNASPATGRRSTCRCRCRSRTAGRTRAVSNGTKPTIVRPGRPATRSARPRP